MAPRQSPERRGNISVGTEGGPFDQPMFPTRPGAMSRAPLAFPAPTPAPPPPSPTPEGNAPIVQVDEGQMTPDDRALHALIAGDGFSAALAREGISSEFIAQVLSTGIQWGDGKTKLAAIKEIRQWIIVHAKMRGMIATVKQSERDGNTTRSVSTDRLTNSLRSFGASRQNGTGAGDANLISTRHVPVLGRRAGDDVDGGGGGGGDGGGGGSPSARGGVVDADGASHPED